MDNETIGELIDDAIAWQLAAQVLAYLATGINGLNAERTLQEGRLGVGKLFTLFDHDKVCWQKIAKAPGLTDAERAFCQERINVLDEISRKAKVRFDTMTEGRM